LGFSLTRAPGATQTSCSLARGDDVISRLSGTLAARDDERLVVDVAGVGYDVAVPLSTFHRLPALGQPLTLEVVMVVREDALLLYGFLTAREKTLFTRLVAVSGVGPRMALAVVGQDRIDEVVAAIVGGRTAALVAAPGIGKKTAERIILELRDKLDDLRRPAGSPGSPVPASSAREDALSALANLGYRRAEAADAVDEALAAGAKGVEDLIKRALSALAR